MQDEARPGGATPEDQPEPEPGAGPGPEAPGVPPYPEGEAPEEMTIGELVLDVSEKTSTLIREEIELARAEVTEKVTKLLRGSVVGIVAGVFAFLALILFMEGIAWLLNDLVFGDRTWPGFLVEGVVFLIVGAIAGLYAFRSVRSGAPPTPEMAIEEAKRTRAELGE
jgi:uncharacterized membrane protein YqjE